MVLSFNILLIDIIDILDKKYTVHIGVDDYIVGAFANVDEIPYKYLKLRVKRIYPGDASPKAIIGIELETLDNED